MVDIKIEYLGGNCPVQAEGTINGIHFYFRARGSHWVMIIGDDTETGWISVHQWNNAGKMSEEEAKRIIEKCAQEFANEGVKDES